MAITGYRRPLTLYPLFQVPLILLGMFLLMALLFWLLGIGRPNLAVAIAIDLGENTYSPKSFNTPNTLMRQEVDFVKAYLNKNSSGTLRQPNTIQIFGFADRVLPLTSSFQKDTQKIKTELDQSLSLDLVYKLGTGSNLSLAVETVTDALSQQQNYCRELLIVTEARALADITIDSTAIQKALDNKVRINVVYMWIYGDPQAGIQFPPGTFGYLLNQLSKLDDLFMERLFYNFNNNWRWIWFWYGLAFICFWWMLVLPLDRWLFQGLFRMPMNLSGRLALCIALFWTAATPGILWRIYQLLDLVFPFIQQC